MFVDVPDKKKPEVKKPAKKKKAVTKDHPKREDAPFWGVFSYVAHMLTLPEHRECLCERLWGDLRRCWDWSSMIYQSHPYRLM